MSDPTSYSMSKNYKEERYIFHRKDRKYISDGYYFCNVSTQCVVRPSENVSLRTAFPYGSVCFI